MPPPDRDPAPPDDHQSDAVPDPLPVEVEAALDAVISLPSRPVRVLLFVVGTIALVVGVVALVLPLIPSTPFLLLAAACYAHASERLYRWLIRQPAIGAVIVRWRASRTIDPDVRRTALLTVVVSFGLSIILVEALAVRVVLVVLAGLVLAILLRIPTSRT